MTTAEQRAWTRYRESLRWALRASERGDEFRCKLALQHAFAQLGADLVAAEQAPTPRYKPELKVLCGEHRAFGLPANDTAADEARINRRWALQDGRTGDAIDAALAEVEAHLAAIAAAKGAR